MYVGSFVVADRLGLMGRGKGKKSEKMKPRWQKRIESSIVDWRKDLSRIEEFRKGKVLRSKVMDQLVRRYDIVEKGAVTVATLLRRKIQSGSMWGMWTAAVGLDRAICSRTTRVSCTGTGWMAG